MQRAARQRLPLSFRPLTLALIAATLALTYVVPAYVGGCHREEKSDPTSTPTANNTAASGLVATTPAASTPMERFIFAQRNPGQSGFLWSDGFAAAGLHVHSIQRGTQKTPSTHIYITFAPVPAPGVETPQDVTLQPAPFARLMFDQHGTPTAPHTTFNISQSDLSGEVKIYIPAPDLRSSPPHWQLATTLPADGSGPIKGVHWLNSTVILEVESMGGSSRIEFRETTKPANPRTGRILTQDIPGMIGITAITRQRLTTPYTCAAPIHIFPDNRDQPLTFAPD